MRHAQAEDNSPDGRDLSRPLHSAGRAACDRLNLGLKAIDLACLPQRVLVSPAARTRQTAQLALNGMNLSVESHPGLWQATAGELLHIADLALSRLDRLMLIAHNPGLETLVRLLGGTLPATGLKPGTLVVLGLSRPLTALPARTLQVLEVKEST